MCFQNILEEKNPEQNFILKDKTKTTILFVEGSCVGLSRWEAGEEKNSLLGEKGGSWLRVHSTTRSMRWVGWSL